MRNSQDWNPGLNSDNMKKYRLLIINSTILFIAATITEMTMHECGHFLAGIAEGAQGLSLHHNYVNYNDDLFPRVPKILIAAAGPFVSLLIGIIFHFICSRNVRRNLTFLFELYMSVFGYIGFFGYLMIAPFFIEGDTGFICHALGFPLWLTGMLAFSGMILLYLLIRSLTPYFVEMGTPEIISEPPERRNFIYSLILIPLGCGIVVTTLLNLPVPTTLSLIAPLFSPFTLMWTFGLAIHKNYPSNRYNINLAGLNRLSPGLFFLTGIIILINRLLVIGIYYH